MEKWEVVMEEVERIDEQGNAAIEYVWEMALTWRAKAPTATRRLLAQPQKITFKIQRMTQVRFWYVIDNYSLSVSITIPALLWLQQPLPLFSLSCRGRVCRSSPPT